MFVWPDINTRGVGRIRDSLCKPKTKSKVCITPLECQYQPMQIQEKTFRYIDTDEILGFFLLLKNHIFIARSEDTILSFMCEDIAVAMVTNINFDFLEQKI